MFNIVQCFDIACNNIKPLFSVLIVRVLNDVKPSFNVLILVVLNNI